MSIERKILKQQAKAIIRETRPSPILVTLVMVLVSLVLQVLGMSLNGDFELMAEMAAALQAGEVFYPEAEELVGFGAVLVLAINIMSMVLSVGYTLYVLRISRRVQAGVGDLFDAFGLFFRAILISIIPALLVSGWSMVYVLPVTYISVSTGAMWPFVVGLPLLIPAFRASYAYRQAVYITLDNPHLNCFQCIALSKTAMEGHKWELLKLDLSFLGWYVLAAIPFVDLWVTPYIRITEAKYYSAVMEDFSRRMGRQ